MDINKKSLLIKICMGIIVIILLRFLYIRLIENKTHISNNKIEHFEINNGDAIDLLSKLKNNSIIPLDISRLGNNIIKPWTTKLYNMQPSNQQSKPLALYQPQLLIKNIQYCKLGDMLCQSNKYEPPASSHYTLLIKKASSDIKPPEKYDLIVDFGDENVNMNYYNYEAFIQSDMSSLNTVIPNIINCSNIFKNINILIQTNLDTLQTNLSNEITSSINITANNKQYSIANLINTGNPINFSITETSFTLPAGMSGILLSNQFVWGQGFNETNPIAITFTVPSTLDALQNNDKTQIASYVSTPFKKIDGNNISITPYKKLLIKLLPINTIMILIQSLCNDISTIHDKQISNPLLLKYLNLVDDIQNINTILTNIDDFNNFVSQYDNINTITINSNPEIQTYVDAILQMNCGNSIIGKVFNILNTYEINYNLTNLTFKEANIAYPIFPITESFEDIPSDNQTNLVEGFYSFGSFFTETVPDGFKKGFDDGLYKQALKPAGYGIRDGFVYIGNGIASGFTPHNSGTKTITAVVYNGNDTDCILRNGTATEGCINNPQLSGGGVLGSGKDKDGKPLKFQFINQLKLTSFTNNFVLNLPKNSLNLIANPAFRTIIKTSMKNLTDFTIFLNGLANNSFKNLPLKIYKPIPPKGYIALGHIFCNLQKQLDEIKQIDLAGNGVCCVPENCVKEIRPWNISDKIFEYNKNGVYWAIYYNPHIGTFISTNTNSLPEGKVCKVVACVKKCTAVDELKKSDDCIRNYYNMNKKHDMKITPDFVSGAEEVYYLDKLKAQSDTITKLYKKANTMQLDVDKATIVNAEMNKNKLQTYVDTQKRNIDIVTKRLQDDANKIDTNVNIPLDVLNKLLDMIKKHKKLSSKQKTDLTNKLLDNKKLEDAGLITKGDYDKNLHKIMSNCPDYDLTGLVKKDVVSNVCYGCPT